MLLFVFLYFVFVVANKVFFPFPFLSKRGFDFDFDSNLKSKDRGLVLMSMLIVANVVLCFVVVLPLCGLVFGVFVCNGSGFVDMVLAYFLSGLLLGSEGLFVGFGKGSCCRIHSSSPYPVLLFERCLIQL